VREVFSDDCTDGFRRIARPNLTPGECIPDPARHRCSRPLLPGMGWPLNALARGLAATKPMKLDAVQQKRLLRLYQQGEPVSELTSMFGISRSTLFRTLKVLKKQEPVSA
jgi:hypothetical protein